MTITAPLAHGTVAAGFEPVREAFEDALTAETDPGAQLAIYLRGRRVVDLWGGQDMTGETLLGLYSSGKGAAHLTAALLVQDGALDLDRAVAHYWPEFAAESKGQVTVRELLHHGAGLIGVPGGFDVTELADDRAIAARLAAQRPCWEPGRAYGYHAFTIGALVGEVAYRVTGTTLHDLYRERVRAPYGLDFFLGLPEAEEARFQPVRPPQTPPDELDPESLTAVAFNMTGPEPTDLVAFANDRHTRALGPFSAGSVGNARGIAKMYAAALSGVDGKEPLLDPATLAEFTAPGMRGTDLVTGEQDHFLLGFEAQAMRYRSLGADAFGHSGAVGAQAFADPATGLAYSYTRRRFAVGGGGGALENGAIIDAAVQAARAEG